MLIDDGVIVVDERGWRVLTERLLAAKVPATLTGVLQARIDSLPPAGRLALQQAAVVGHVFSQKALAAIDPAALEALPYLVHRRLVVPRDEGPDADGGEYAFQHQLLQQVTYESVLKHSQFVGHARVGTFWRAHAEVASAEQVNAATCHALAEAYDHCRRCDPGTFVAWFDSQFSNYLGAYVGRILRPLAESVLELCVRHRGPNDVETARALTNLARLLLQQRDTDDAEPLLARALRIQEGQLGTDHQDTARTVAVLGGFHQARGDVRAAEPFFRRALGIRERILGPEDPLTLGTLDNLAAVVIELGRFDEAESLFRRVLAAHERLHGAGAPGTARARTALAEVLVKRGELAQAEGLLRGALAVQESVLGVEHPDVGLTQWHLAEALRAAGRIDEAEPLARQMLKVVETAFGDKHEWTGWGLRSLAEIYLAQGQYAQAQQCAERAQAIFERHFGAQHSEVAAMLVVRARAMLKLGLFADAVPLLERVLMIQSASADDSGRTRWSVNDLLAQAGEGLARLGME